MKRTHTHTRKTSDATAMHAQRVQDSLCARMGVMAVARQITATNAAMAANTGRRRGDAAAAAVAVDDGVLGCALRFAASSRMSAVRERIAEM